MAILVTANLEGGTMERYLTWSPTSAILMMGFLFLSFGLITPRAWAVANTGHNANVERLLDRANYQAQRLNRDTNQMTALINSDVGWQPRVSDLARVKVRVNDLDKVINKLESPRVDASPWQKASIDHVVPLLNYVSVNTTDEINYLKSHYVILDSPQYNKLAFQSADMAQELSGRISDIVRYENDKSQLARLSHTLTLPARITSTNG